MLIIQSEQGFLPKKLEHVVHKDHAYIRALNEAPLKINNQLQGRVQYENLLMRKRFANKKSPKLQVNDESSFEKYPKTKERYQVYKNRNFKTGYNKYRHFDESSRHYDSDDRYRHYVRPRHFKKRPMKFNDRGMIFLSNPKFDGNRKINKLMNKIIKYKMELDDKGVLRHKLHDIFSAEEFEEMKKIVSDLDKVDTPVTTTPKLVYEFSELVN